MLLLSPFNFYGKYFKECAIKIRARVLIKKVARHKKTNNHSPIWVINFFKVNSNSPTDKGVNCVRFVGSHKKLNFKCHQSKHLFFFLKNPFLPFSRNRYVVKKACSVFTCMRVSKSVCLKLSINDSCKKLRETNKLAFCNKIRNFYDVCFISDGEKKEKEERIGMLVNFL